MTLTFVIAFSNISLRVILVTSFVDTASDAQQVGQLLNFNHLKLEVRILKLILALQKLALFRTHLHKAGFKKLI